MEDWLNIRHVAIDARFYWNAPAFAASCVFPKLMVAQASENTMGQNPTFPVCPLHGFRWVRHHALRPGLMRIQCRTVAGAAAVRNTNGISNATASDERHHRRPPMCHRPPNQDPSACVGRFAEERLRFVRDSCRTFFKRLRGGNPRHSHPNGCAATQTAADSFNTPT